MRLIDADALKRQYEAHKRLFCRNRIEFSTLSDKDKARVDELDSCIADILNAPTIEERKTGEWNFIGNQMFECSECGTCYTQSQFYQMRVRISDTEFPKFCPNCGADMRGEGEK